MPLYGEYIAFGTIDPTDDEQTSLEMSDVYEKYNFSTLDPQRILIGVRRGKYYSSTLRSIDVDLWDDVFRIHVASTNVKSQFTRNIRGTQNVVLALRCSLLKVRLY